MNNIEMQQLVTKGKLKTIFVFCISYVVLPAVDTSERKKLVFISTFTERNTDKMHAEGKAAFHYKIVMMFP